MPFKANQDRRHHIPKQRHRVTNWAAYDIALRQRGSLTVWFEKHAAKVRRCWRKLHIGVDADTGQIIAAELTSKDVDDGSLVGPLLEQIAGR